MIETNNEPDPNGLSLEQILARIAEIAPSLHSAGTLTRDALVALFRHATKRRVDYSAETGAGATTLLLSHLSKNHTVFALDGGSGSITNVKASALLEGGTVTFVEGPTQQTLPRHQFSHKLQAVVIDGPHAYPFPDLEYYFLYPHLEQGGLLVLDDIHIRGVHNLFNFLRADRMFQLDEVVRSTAFFTRTGAPTFDPIEGSWLEQNYNRKLFLRYTWKGNLKRRLPWPVRRAVESALLRRPISESVNILVPAKRENVTGTGPVEGIASLTASSHLWILVRRKDLDGWWPQAGGQIAVHEGRWRAVVRYGEPCDAGFDFEVAAVIVGEATHELWISWVERAKAWQAAPLQIPSCHLLGADYRTVRKAPDLTDA
jgi:hypothetical protein